MRLIDEDKVISVIERFIGYLDEDMIERIKIAIKKDVPTAATEITGFSTSNVTNEIIKRFGYQVEDKVKGEVLLSTARQLYESGAITIERVEDRAQQMTVYIGRASVLKKEGDLWQAEHK